MLARFSLFGFFAPIAAVAAVVIGGALAICTQWHGRA
jgi:hypothetical protein